jgi:hypothetical protein
MNRLRPISIGAKPLLSTALLVVMALSLSGCPTINALLGDAPFNGVYCDQNAAGCHDRESESPPTSNSPSPAPSDPAPAPTDPTPS